MRSIRERMVEDIKKALNSLVGDKTIVWYNVNGEPMFAIKDK